MSTIELKNKLHSLIDSIGDSEKLKAILTLLKGNSESTIDWWDELTNEQKENVDIGLAELDNGEGIPHEEVMKSVNQFLGRV